MSETEILDMIDALRAEMKSELRNLERDIDALRRTVDDHGYDIRDLEREAKR